MRVAFVLPFEYNKLKGFKMKTVKSVSASSVARELYKANFPKKGDEPVGVTIEKSINSDSDEVLVINWGYLPGTALEHLNELGYVCGEMVRSFCETSQRHLEAFVVYGRSN
jgi:hypothetical protein